MPDSENKKRPLDPLASVTRPEDDGESGAMQDESSVYGDEADVPARRRKRAASKSGGKKGKGKRAAGKSLFSKNRKGKKKPSEKKQLRRTYGNLFELMNATGSNSLVKPIRIFGREFRFWPLVIAIVVVLLAAGVMLNDGSITVLEQTVTVVGLPDELEGYRIIVMSDLNGRRFGDEQSLLLRTINNLKYDAVFCVGDMVGKGGNAEPFLEFLDGLRNPEKVYFICGDSDPGPYLDKPRGTSGKLANLVLEDWIVEAMDRGANYVDAPIKLPLKESTVWLSPANMLNLETTTTREFWENQMKQEQDGYLAGITEDRDSLPITTYRYNTMQTLYDVQRTMNASDIHISLAHIVPTDEYIYTSEEHNVNTDRYLVTPELIIAGHYCGGVWRVPLLGAFFVPDSTLPRGGWFPDQSKVEGLSTVGETQVYITGGMSTNSDVPLMPFRLFNGPEITVLTLTSTLPENMLTAE